MKKNKFFSLFLLSNLALISLPKAHASFFSTGSSEIAQADCDTCESCCETDLGECPEFESSPFYSYNGFNLSAQFFGGGTFGETVGVDDGYGFFGLQLGLLSPSGSYYQGIEANAFVFEDGKWAANFNKFTRWYDNCLCSCIGLYYFFDFRQGCTKTFSQGGIGFEGYFPCFFITGNAYIPFGNTRGKSKKKVFTDYIGDFKTSSQRFEYSFIGFNIEIGKDFCLRDNLVIYPKIGPYYFSSRRKDFWGIRLYAGIRYRSRLGLDLNLTHDRIFNTRVQATFFFSIPIGTCADPCCYCEPFCLPIDRFRVMPLIQCCEYERNF